MIKDDNGSELEQVRCRGPVASISTRRLEEGKGEVGVDGVHRWCRCVWVSLCACGLDRIT